MLYSEGVTITEKERQKDKSRKTTRQRHETGRGSAADDDLPSANYCHCFHYQTPHGVGLMDEFRRKEDGEREKKKYI